MTSRTTAYGINIEALEVLSIQLITEQKHTPLWFIEGFQKLNHMKALSALFHCLYFLFIFPFTINTVNYNFSDLIQIHLMTEQ